MVSLNGRLYNYFASKPWRVLIPSLGERMHRISGAQKEGQTVHLLPAIIPYLAIWKSCPTELFYLCMEKKASLCGCANYPMGLESGWRSVPERARGSARSERLVRLIGCISMHELSLCKSPVLGSYRAIGRKRDAFYLYTMVGS